jgi:hypothetical protein
MNMAAKPRTRSVCPQKNARVMNGLHTVTMDTVKSISRLHKRELKNAIIIIVSAKMVFVGQQDNAIHAHAQQTLEARVRCSRAVGGAMQNVKRDGACVQTLGHVHWGEPACHPVRRTLVARVRGQHVPETGVRLIAKVVSVYVSLVTVPVRVSATHQIWPMRFSPTGRPYLHFGWTMHKYSL